MLGIAEGDPAAVVDEDRRHPHPVDVDPGFAAVDGEPLTAAVVKHDLRRRECAVEADVGSVVMTDGDVPAGGEDISTRAEPNDEGWTERPIGRHGHPLSRPSSWSRTTLVHSP
ncbi:hypothetical protein GCM10009641_20590 [Mycobacterium cookii]|uniref:Uncharacterized protein n=1 Tax=Mycobacterium cookii TaxID=1775 RepID=A0A7I7KTC2_9MYCO|nr:hypothetical protein MCOO_13650 [Mycobacterium cookii]